MVIWHFGYSKILQFLHQARKISKQQRLKQISEVTVVRKSSLRSWPTRLRLLSAFLTLNASKRSAGICLWIERKVHLSRNKKISPMPTQLLSPSLKSRSWIVADNCCFGTKHSKDQYVQGYLWRCAKIQTEAIEVKRQNQIFTSKLQMKKNEKKTDTDIVCLVSKSPFPTHFVVQFPSRPRSCLT